MRPDPNSPGITWKTALLLRAFRIAQSCTSTRRFPDDVPQTEAPCATVVSLAEDTCDLVSVVSWAIVSFRAISDFRKQLQTLLLLLPSRHSGDSQSSHLLQYFLHPRITSYQQTDQTHTDHGVFVLKPHLGLGGYFVTLLMKPAHLWNPWAL